MNLFISDAQAQIISDAYAQAPGGPAGALSPIIMLIAMVAIFYFLVMRPQAKRAKEHKSLLEGLAKGDEVVTAGGVLGKVTDLGENFITLDVGNSVEIKFQRHQIASLVPKGTVKSA